MDVRASSPISFLVRQQDHSDDHLGRARALLERAIRQRWADGLIAREADGTTGPLGQAEVERLAREQAPVLGNVDDYELDVRSPVGDLARSLGISPTKADLIAVLLACETDPASARLAAYLSGVQSAALSVDTLFEIVYRPRAVMAGHAATMLHADLAGESGARRLRFLVVDGAESRPFLAQTVRLHPRLTGWLLGRRGLDSELTSHARLLPPDAIDAALDPQQLGELVRAFTDRDRVVVLHGIVGAGRDLLLRMAARHFDRPLLLVSGRGLDPDRIISAFREATLHDALLAFKDVEEALAGEGRIRFRECLEAYPGTVAMTGVGGLGSISGIVGFRPITEITIAVPPHNERLALWSSYLPAPRAVTDIQLREIAGLYNLGVGGIVNACSTARDMAARSGAPVSRTHVAHAVRQLFDADLSAVAKRVEVSQSWDDVVLPDDVIDSVVGIVDRVAFRNEVLGDWGFGRKVGKGLGITLLFSGQPGTGKSMVAGLIARELGLDLYVIDLSRIMSKWLGETEKNLGRAFDAAEAGHVLLLFDEADSILGKRTTDIKSSNDRHANLETNFILARLEQFHGIAAFTTNIASAIDPAIMRRMSANIAFPFPDLEARAELWRRMIPAEAPVEGPIDFIKLAKAYEMSGGFIRNVVLRAAYLAAREGKAISTAMLDRAARGEYGDRGALTTGGRMM